MTMPFVLLTAAAQHALREASPHCYFRAAAFRNVDLYAVDQVIRLNGVVLGHGVLLPRSHPLASASESVQGAFHRAPAEAHGMQLAAAWRDQMLTFTGLRELVPALELIDGGLVVTYVPDHAEHGVAEFAGWYVTTQGASAVHVECEPDTYGAADLEPQWPSSRLRGEHVLLIGAGTIGSAAAHALGGYGVGDITIMDPGRLRFHNLKRLPYTGDDVGRHKVDVVAAAVRAAWPDTHVEPLPYDAVRAAAVVRGMANEVSLIVCTADGVIPRRLADHVARRAGIDCVLGCVLDDGAVGEVMRLRAVAGQGCLRCRRAALADAGVLAYAPETDLHRAYGSGFLHKPMTAVGGDLALVGQATAKVAVATLLENAGRGVQALPGENLLIRLRASDVAGDYGGDSALDMTWTQAVPPRPDCFTCGPQSGAGCQRTRDVA